MFSFILKEFFTLIKIFFIIDILRFYYKYFTRPNPLPGPIPLPYVGNAFQILYMLFKEGIYQFDLGEYARLQVAKYGEISEVYQGNARLIYLSRVEYLEKIYSSNTNTIYFSRPVLNGIKEFKVDHGLFFNNDYKNWKRIRKFVSQSLMSPKFIRGITNTIQNLFEDYEYKFKIRDEIIFDLSDWIKCFTTDITISTSTGQKSYCLASNNLKDSEWTEKMKESRKILKTVELYFKSLAFFTTIPKFIRHYFPIFNYYQNYFMNNITCFQNNILGKIKKRREQIRQMSENENVGVDLLDILLTSDTPKDDADKPLDDIEIRDNILDLTIAGIDTSSNLFSLTFWYINFYPEVKARLLEEIRSNLGEDFTEYKITYEDLEKLKYLDAVIKESSRMKPIIPVTARVLSSSDTIAGYKWDANTFFFMNSISIQHNKDYWKDPEKFIPDRFLKDEIIKNSFVPFGSGIRSCPGKFMAMTVIKILIVLFFGKYNVELVDKVNPLQHTYAGVNLYSNLMIKLSSKKKK